MTDTKDTPAPLPSASAETLLPFLAKLQSWRDADNEDWLTLSRHEVVTLIDEIRAAAIDAKSESPAVPVAWRTRWRDDNSWNTTYTRGEADGWMKAGLKVEPLYTAPPPAPAVREAFVKILNKELDELMMAAENYFGAINPKRSGHLYCTKEAILREFDAAIASDAGGKL